MKRFLGLGGALLASIFAVDTVGGCSDDPSPGTPAALEIGTLSSLSGDLASLGIEFNDAANLAVEDINAAGGVLDRPLKLVVQDDGTSPEGAKVAFPKLATLKVPIILGPTTSGQVVEIADQLASAGIVTIGRTTTADQLSDIPDNGYFFRITPADAFQSEVLASLITTSGIEALCLVHRRDTYGKNLALRVEQKLGANVKVTTSEYDPARADLSSVMTACAALVCDPSSGGDAGTDADAGDDAGDGGSSGADSGAPCTAPSPEKVGLLAITFVDDGALILDDAKKKGWSAKKQKFFFTDGAYDRGLLTRVKDLANLEGSLGTAPAGPNPDTPEGENYRRFQARYQQRYGRPAGIFVENSYDSVYIAAAALEIAKTATPGASVRDAMAKVSVPGGKKVVAGDWASIRAAIKAGESIDFDGASGPCDFDGKGDITPPYNYVIWTVKDGNLAVTDRRTVTP